MSQLEQIRAEILRLKASTHPGIGWRVKAGQFQLVSVIPGAKRMEVKPLSGWMTATALLEQVKRMGTVSSC